VVTAWFLFHLRVWHFAGYLGFGSCLANFHF
jgi:hypothetical protein